MSWIKRVMERGRPPVAAPYATTPRGYPFPLRSWPPDAAIDIQNLAQAIDTDVAAATAPGSWQTLTLTPPWVNVDPGGATFGIPNASYRVIGKTCYLRGAIKGATTENAWILQGANALPAGARPASTFTMGGFCAGTAGANIADVWLYSDGNLRLSTATVTYPVQQLNLSGLSWPVG